MLLLTLNTPRPYAVTHHTTAQQVTSLHGKILYSFKKILYQKYLSLDNVYSLAKCSVNQKYLFPVCQKYLYLQVHEIRRAMMVAVFRAVATCCLLWPSRTLTGGDEQMR